MVSAFALMFCFPLFVGSYDLVAPKDLVELALLELGAEFKQADRLKVVSLSRAHKLAFD